ncbi:GNAT family N-acetyltransferase [Aliifodinibius sp. S!AR15-10]|uniref:GNAT family N-acetyltransferase n=1 Tax=Aliifodinibius sp. S!AR15-10 TaxID=2950437 RepID=UPI00285A3566|nr:GNAT family N-acyltransferase [Aliifodinibius sp. S!AR15-10]MDR8391624.1 GNAT family N-acetyltransferase [Aliifodinibius sp. S!AR15-10]
MPELLKTIDVIQGLPHNLVSNNRYVVRFAQTEKDLAAAQRLRFEVFNLELGEGLESSFELQRDVDPYDDQCHHLMVIEKSSENIIGTYRMQTYNVAQTEKGFYTQEEYRLSDLPQHILKDSVEVGRACIQKDHRNGRVLYLLWRGLAKYLMHTNSRYLFGCCSLTSQDETIAWQVMEFLRRNNHVHPELRAETKPEYQCGPVDVEPRGWKKVKLPQLFRLYMDLGAKVCSPPAIDREFKTIDYLVILDIETLDERTRALFFK